MKCFNLSTVVLLCLFPLLLSAQESETRDLGSFNGIAVSSSVNAKIAKGNSNEITLKVSGVELSDITTEIEGGILKVGVDRKNSIGRWLKSVKIEATISYTGNIDYLSASSSADLVSDGVIKTEKLELKASSSADLEVEVDVADLKAMTSSSADLIVSGKAKKAVIQASSSADFKGRKLSVDDAQLSSSSSADIQVTVVNSIKAMASSSGDIVYYGNPGTKSINKSSGGRVSSNK